MGSVYLLASFILATRKKEEKEEDIKGKKKEGRERERIFITRIRWLVIRIRISALFRALDWLGRTARFSSASHCACGEGVA